MNTLVYLKELYDYSEPIFLKDIRIGRKSKTAIRKELSRGVEKGLISRKKQGVYYFEENSDIPKDLSFENVVEIKFIKKDCGLPGLYFDIYGYYTGQTFLHLIGISQQVPAVLEITTNNTSCKRVYQFNNFKAVLRKGRIKIDRFNYQILQFLDMFNFLSDEEVREHKQLIYDYILKCGFSRRDFEKYIVLYKLRVNRLITMEGLLNAFR